MELKNKLRNILDLQTAALCSAYWAASRKLNVLLTSHLQPDGGVHTEPAETSARSKPLHWTKANIHSSALN